MNLIATLKQHSYILYDGPMETRIEYDSSLKLDNAGSIFQIIYLDEGREALRRFYQTDIRIAIRYHMPIILNAPTWRASWAHIQRVGHSTSKDVETINHDCITFVKDIRNEYPEHPIFITASIGPELTDYQTDSSTSVEKAAKYHALQAKAVAKAGVDIISIAAMSGMIETIGCAEIVAQMGTPYSVGVVLNDDGTLLDGSLFKDVIHRIDESISPPPHFYVINCTHPVTAKSALSDHAPCYARILGIKANGSSQPVRALLNAGHPIADEPEVFAKALVALGKEYHFQIYGGCCGTDHRHLEALAQILGKMQHK